MKFKKEKRKIYGIKSILFVKGSGIVKEYYDGKHIVMEEDIEMVTGQGVIVTVLNMSTQTQRRLIKKYMGRREKLFHEDVQEYIREMRNNDRI